MISPYLFILCYFPNSHIPCMRNMDVYTAQRSWCVKRFKVPHHPFQALLGVHAWLHLKIVPKLDSMRDLNFGEILWSPFRCTKYHQILFFSSFNNNLVSHDIRMKEFEFKSHHISRILYVLLLIKTVMLFHTLFIDRRSRALVHIHGQTFI